jgi:hypothetical protein
MKSAIQFLLLLATCALSGCATPGQTYASHHPELPAAQLQILRTGKVPDGDAIAGMTQEQIKLAMSIEPTQYIKVDGHDAWVYVQKRLTSNGFSSGPSELDRRDKRNKDGGTPEDHSLQGQPDFKTTIFFNGDVATRAEVVNGGL